MYLEARICIVEKTCVLFNCKAFGGSRAKTRRCISRQEDVFLRKFVFLIVRPSVGEELRLEDVSRDKKMYFEQTCVV